MAALAAISIHVKVAMPERAARLGRTWPEGLRNQVSSAQGL
jgi:hypothetical protein